jgi:hypothetical protein
MGGYPSRHGAGRLACRKEKEPDRAGNAGRLGITPEPSRSQTPMESILHTTAAKPQRRKSTKPDKPKSSDRVKATIVMDRQLHCMLSSIAGFQGMDGSELAELLIDRGLRDRHKDQYEALKQFEAKPPRKAKPDASGDSTDRTGDPAGITSDASEKAA